MSQGSTSNPRPGGQTPLPGHSPPLSGDRPSIPGSQTPAPGGSNLVPGGDTPIPGGSNLVPGGDTPIPGGSNPAPGGDTPIPGGDTPAPGSGSSLTGGSNRIPALDGLRGMAILWVLIWHYVPLAQNWFPGWAGVNLFFVLSGYLITDRLLATRQNSGYLATFYRHRALRTLPLYYATIIPFFLLIWIRNAAQNPALAFYAHHWPAFFVLIQNWIFVQVRPLDLTLLPTWSLAVEEQLYLISPLLVGLILPKQGRWKLLPALMITILAARTASSLQNPAAARGDYYSTFFRMDGFLAGSIVCWLRYYTISISRKILIATTLALLIITMAGCCLSGNTLPYNIFFSTIGSTVLALLFAGTLLLILTDPRQAFARFFNNQTLRYCGKISYGLYIFNYPLLAIAGNRLIKLGTDKWPHHPDIILCTVYLLCLVLTFIVSALSFRYFESLFRPATSSGTSSRTRY